MIYGGLFGVRAAVGAVASVLAAAVLVSTMVARPAGATFPGAGNGKIVSVMGSISTVNPDGSELTNLTPLYRVYAAQWAPDGSKILFVRLISRGEGEIDYDVYTMDPDGSNEKNLTHTPEFGGGPRVASWTPDGKVSYWNFPEPGCEGVALRTMNADGGGLETNFCLTEASPLSELYWSPDGTKLAFRGWDNGALNIYVINADGTGLKKVVRGVAEEFTSVDQLAWSPDGKRLLFTRGPVGGDISNNKDIFSVNPDGSEPTNLTDSPAYEDRPLYSPDGKKISFSRYRGKHNYDIYTMNPDGSDKRRLTDGPGAQNFNTWSPNGKKIAYVRDRDTHRSAHPSVLHVMNADGTGKRSLHVETFYYDPARGYTSEPHVDWQPLCPCP